MPTTTKRDASKGCPGDCYGCWWLGRSCGCNECSECGEYQAEQLDNEGDGKSPCAACKAGPRIVDEEYERGVPGRACLACNSAWPTTEPDDAPWHHAVGCTAVAS